MRSSLVRADVVANERALLIQENLRLPSSRRPFRGGMIAPVVLLLASGRPMLIAFKKTGLHLMARCHGDRRATSVGN